MDSSAGWRDHPAYVGVNFNAGRALRKRASPKTSRRSSAKLNRPAGAEMLGLQSEFLSRQMQALSTQVQDLGQSAAKVVVDAAKPKT